EGFARAKNVAFGERRRLGAALREEIAAEERFRRPLEEIPALPAVRQVRRVEPLEGLGAEREQLPIRQRFRRAVGELVDRTRRRDLTAHRNGIGRRLEPFVERAALVSLEV